MHILRYPRGLGLGAALSILIPVLPLRALDPASPVPLPIEELFRPEAVDATLLSPDGKHLAATSIDQEGTRSLVVMELGTGKVRDVLLGAAQYNGTPSPVLPD